MDSILQPPGHTFIDPSPVKGLVSYGEISIGGPWLIHLSRKLFAGCWYALSVIVSWPVNSKVSVVVKRHSRWLLASSLATPIFKSSTQISTDTSTVLSYVTNPKYLGPQFGDSHDIVPVLLLLFIKTEGTLYSLTSSLSKPSRRISIACKTIFLQSSNTSVILWIPHVFCISNSIKHIEIITISATYIMSRAIIRYYIIVFDGV